MGGRADTMQGKAYGDDVAGENRVTSAYIQELVDKCRVRYENCEHFNDKTKREYAEMIAGLARDRNIEWLEQNVDWLDETIEKAEKDFWEYSKKLEDAVKNKWMSETKKKGWIKRYKDANLLEFERKIWIHEHFDAFIGRWQKAAEKRTEALNLAAKEGVTAREVPELLPLLFDEVFLGKDYFGRQESAAKANAAILARKYKLESLYRDAYLTLAEATRGSSRYLHPSKIGPWMERIFRSPNPAGFMRQIVKPSMEDRKTTRDTYDAAYARMGKVGIPRGFIPLPLDDFLLMDFAQRKSHADSLKDRLRSKEIDDVKELADFKMGIRHELDTGYWEGAERLLNAATREFPHNHELASMERYLAAHRGAEKKKGKEQEKSVADINFEIQDILREYIPECIHELYRKVLEDERCGESFGALRSTMFNRVWVREHGYSSDEQEIRDAQSELYKNQTQEHIEKGHTKYLEKNILENKTAQEEAIRDECTSPQVVFADHSIESQAAFARKAIKNKGNWGFKYWTSFTPPIPYAQQEYIVKHVNTNILRLAWKLQNQGYSFRRDGGPHKVGETFTAPVQSPIAASAETVASMGA